MPPLLLRASDLRSGRRRRRGGELQVRDLDGEFSLTRSSLRLSGGVGREFEQNDREGGDKEEQGEGEGTRRKEVVLDGCAASSGGGG
eukprot:749768-Hanusia_phi.AAC.2